MRLQGSDLAAITGRRGSRRGATSSAAANKRAFSGEPSERSERPERKRGRRVRCNAMLGGTGGARARKLRFMRG